jgi:hypothetical protein
MEKVNKDNFYYHIINIEDKCLVLKIDFSVSLSKACEVIALFSPERKKIAEKLVKELNEKTVFQEPKK